MELSELIESVDILEYISQYTEFTEKNGEYWALSPFKDEKTPSFSVRKETNSFYDFSSGIGGNVLTFIRYYDKCGYAEAIEKLKITAESMVMWSPERNWRQLRSPRGLCRRKSAEAVKINCASRRLYGTV